MNISRVLVVDDDDAVCRIVERMLFGKYQVRAANSVATALKVIEEESFAVYVLDYKLPDGSGLDVAVRIREQREAAPIILISGYDPGVVALRAGQLCITEFLQKPFSREMLSAAVKKAIDASASTIPPGSDSKGSSTGKPMLVSFIPRLNESKVPWKD